MPADDDPEPRTADERRLQWDERHAAGDFEGAGPNPTLVDAVAAIPMQTGRALELACGGGTNAVWLAEQGWQVTAVDWSQIGLEAGRTKAAAAGVEIDWQERNLFEWEPPERSFDLVVIVYLHLPSVERVPVYRAAAAAVAPGGSFVVVGHDRSHATEGEGGGPPPERLFTADEIAAELAAGDSALHVDRAVVVRQVRPVHRPDALVVIRRTAEKHPARA